MAQVTFIADEATQNGSDSSTSTVVNKPTGTTDGDLLLAITYSNDTGVNVNTLTGWTLLDEATNADSGEMRVYWKIASSEGSSYTWTHVALGGSSTLQIHISTWRNAHATSPFIWQETADTGLDATSEGTGITTDTTPHGILLQAHGYKQGNASISGYAVANNNPAWSEINDATTSNSAGRGTLGIAYATYEFAQATGNVSATVTTDENGGSCVFLIFIRPAGFSFSVPTMASTATLIAPAVAAAIAIPLLTASFTTYAPTVATADPEITNTAKNAASMTNTSKNAATASNTSKTSSTWSNTSKS